VRVGSGGDRETWYRDSSVAVDLFAEYLALAAALDEAKVEHALCGALALAVHGVPRATRDIDILAGRADAAALRDIVRRLGFTFEALPMSFASGVEIQRYSKLIEGHPLMLDVLWVDEALASVFEQRIRVPLTATTIPVVTRDALITLKLTAGRPQDLVDIQRLTAAGEGRE